MQKNEKKQMLISYSALCLEAQAKIAERKNWLDILCVTGKETETDISEKIWQIDSQLSAEVTQLINLRNRTENMISAIDDPILRTILQRRYLLGEHFDTIAESMNYSWRHIMRLHDKAISSL